MSYLEVILIKHIIKKKKKKLNYFSLWPQYVKDRIKSTYLYLGSSLVITASSAVAAFRSPVIMNLVARNGFVVFKLK